jgi:hypothetical protein
MLTPENLDFINASTSFPRGELGARPIRKKSIKLRIVEGIKNLYQTQLNCLIPNYSGFDTLRAQPDNLN